MRLLLATAFPLGMLAAVNPCAFPLLPAYLARFSGVGNPRAKVADRVRKSLLDGAAMTAGFVGVFAAIGASASLVLRPVLAVVPGALLVLGAALVAAAVLTLVGRAPALRLPLLRLPSGTGPSAALGFGIVYGVASLGCALPLFAAAVGEAATTAGWLGVVIADLAYALGMGLLVTAVGMIVAGLGAAASRRMAPFRRTAPLLGAVLTGATGIAIGFVGLRDLGVPAPPLLDAAQSGVSSLLAAAPALLGGGLGLLVVAWLAFMAVHELRTRGVQR